MSVTYFLHRVKMPLSERGLMTATCAESDFLPMGPLDEIAERLEAALGRRGPVSRQDEPGGPATNPFTGRPMEMDGKAMELPPRVTLTFSSVSRELEAVLSHDPVQLISINRCHPRDFLPIVDALRDLGPFALSCDSDEKIVDPEDYRPREPALVQEVLLLLPFTDGVSTQPCSPRWQVEGAAYLSSPPIYSANQILLAPMGSQLTALDVATGETRWTQSFQRSGMHATCAGDVIVCAGHHPRCFGLSLMTGEKIWHTALHGEAFQPGGLLSNGNVALAVHTKPSLGDVHVINPLTGERVWWAQFEHARTMSVAPAGEFLLVGAGECVHCWSVEDGEARGSFRWRESLTGGFRIIPRAGPMAAIGSTGVFLGMESLTRRSIPALDDEDPILTFHERAGFESFVSNLSDNLVVAGTPSDAENGLLSVFEGPELRLLYEIPIQASPSGAVAVTSELWACLLRPLRERAGAEAEVILVETRTGRIVLREPLGCRGWYQGHVAGGNGWMFATTQRRSVKDRSMVSGIRAYRV